MTVSPPSGDATALLEERPWLERALAAMRDGVIIFDGRARIAHANPAAMGFAGRIGLSRDSARWPAEHGLFLPDRKTPYPADALPVWRVLRGEAVRDVELYISNERVREGAYVLVNGSPLRSPDGDVRGAVLIFRDVTERRAQERKIAVAEQQKKAILDNIPDMTWLKDIEGRYLAANRPLAENAGLSSPEELVGLTDHHLWPKELADGYRAADLEVMRTGRPLRLEERFVDAGGKAYWLETVKAAVFGPNAEIIGTTGLARDVTVRREAEQALRQLAEELEHRVQQRTAELEEAQQTIVRKERLAALGQLAGGVAHQIRNPLAAIMNASYVLKRHLGPSELHPDADQALKIIHDEVRHANVIITSLLDFARVRSLERQRIAVGDLVARAFATQAVPEDIVVVHEIAEVRPVDVDVDQIQGALANLVRNALDAMADGGGTVTVEVRQDADEVVIAVSDTGPGLSPQIVGHLFEPLHSTKPLGIGLGLVTAKTFIEAHGGRIHACPAARGACFEVRLPAARAGD